MILLTFKYQRVKLTGRGLGKKIYYKYHLLQDVCVDTKITPAVSLKVIKKKIKFIDLAPSGILKIYKGYSWNGASGIPDTKANMFAALVHDALYQLMREYNCKVPAAVVIDGISRTGFRLAADELFRAHYKKNGGWHWWIAIVFWFLRKFGESSTLCDGGSNKKKGKLLSPNQHAPALGSVSCPEQPPGSSE